MRSFVVFGIFLLAVMSGCSSAQTNTSEGLQSINVEGVERNWRLYLPPSHTKDKKWPLVLDFHGTASNPSAQAELSGFETLAAKEGFLVVTPAAKYTMAKDGRVTWNVDQQKDGVDDVKFIRELVGYLRQNYAVDPSRIYAAGMSGGARMSSRLGCDLGDVIAAIAPVAGVRYPENCSPARPVPVITFHGKKDNVNHYVHSSKSQDYWRMGVEEALAGWVANNQCDNQPVSESITPAATRITYNACKGGGDIVFYRSEEAGHTWPSSLRAAMLEKYGLGKTDMDILATELIWDFFEGHPLP